MGRIGTSEQLQYKYTDQSLIKPKKKRKKRGNKNVVR